MEFQHRARVGSNTRRIDLQPSYELRGPLYCLTLFRGRKPISSFANGAVASVWQQIFEPFRQLGESGIDRPQGYGLGLAISRSICDLLGFSLFVQSQPGRGSTFSICFNQEMSRVPLGA